VGREEGGQEERKGERGSHFTASLLSPHNLLQWLRHIKNDNAAPNSAIDQRLAGSVPR